MTANSVIFRNGRIFDGTRLLEGLALRVTAGRVAEVAPDRTLSGVGKEVDLAGDILSPGFVDLQVNGGGGVMFNGDPSLGTLQRIAEAHHRLGVRAFLPTLITDTPEVTKAAIAAAQEACRTGVSGIAGLHLEGPHLSIARKGAHDPDLIRPMEDADIDLLVTAAGTLPVLKVTIAPESVTEEQVRALTEAGICVSLGHTDAGFETCLRYAAAGARCVTHLFNAMSQLGNREPGVVGAALTSGDLSAGIIADGVHVHPDVMRAALAAKTGPGRIFLVSDAMAVAGTDETEFELNGRPITRRTGVLTLQDGTLAGADLDLTTAIRVMVEKVGLPLETALQAATSVPAGLVGIVLPDITEVGTELLSVIRIASDLSGATALE